MNRHDFLTNRIKKAAPYTAGEQLNDKKYIKLNTNENPYPPSHKIKEAIEHALTHLRLYPDADSFDLCKAIANVENVKAENIFCGNGSDEVLSFVFYAFFDNDRPLLFPDITYSFYPVYAGYYDVPYQQIPLNDHFEINVNDYFQPASGVIFPNPNAPTSVYLERDEIKKLIEYHTGKVVVIDEAYIAFGGESMVSFINQYSNLLVVRTLSKSHALAGMRVGYAIGQPHLIDALRRAKDSFNSYPVDRIAAEAAKAAVLDEAYYKSLNERIIKTRDLFIHALQKINFTVLPSKTNFIFTKHSTIHAGDIYRYLRAQGILVRHFKINRIENYLRISIGTDEDMKYVYDKLKSLTL